ncbi:SGNH/GDSL hydrolase family protein [soil metagenome]
MKLPLVSLLSLCLISTLAFSADAPAKKRILLLGDSISIGYTPIVQKTMAEEAVVQRPMKADGKPENCSGTTNGITNIDRWLQIEGGKWDVVHFNWGLHDIKHVDAKGAVSNLESDAPQASLEAYEKQVRELVAKLKATGAKLIFATTTPVPDAVLKPWRTNADVIRYNEVALKIMKENQIAVDDLYTFMKPKLAELQLPANVHYKPEGYQALGGEVVKAIQGVLK